MVKIIVEIDIIGIINCPSGDCKVLLMGKLEICEIHLFIYFEIDVVKLKFDIIKDTSNQISCWCRPTVIQPRQNVTYREDPKFSDKDVDPDQTAPTLFSILPVYIF